MRATRHRLAVVVALIVALFAAGCGVGTESAPQALDEESVPFGLLEPAVTTTTSTTVRAQPLVDIQIYLMGSERLHPVVRQVPAPATVRQAITVLFAGDVRDDELAAGLRNAINPNIELLDVQVSADGVVTVDLGDNFLEASTQEQRVALAQIVFTATGIPGIVGVRFALEGEPREVPTDQGAQSGPLTRAAFSQLDPNRPPPPETAPPPPPPPAES